MSHTDLIGRYDGHVCVSMFNAVDPGSPPREANIQPQRRVLSRVRLLGRAALPATPAVHIGKPPVTSSNRIYKLPGVPAILRHSALAPTDRKSEQCHPNRVDSSQGPGPDRGNTKSESVRHNRFHWQSKK